MRAVNVLAAAGVWPGELSLHLGRHFSLRDLFKWCRRMQVGGGCRRDEGGLDDLGG